MEFGVLLVMTPIIKLKNITKVFNRGKHNELTVLKKVNLEVAKSEFLALVGPSGSGKSTLMNIIGLLDRSTKGQYLLNGREVSGVNGSEAARIRREEIGFVFQNFNLLARFSALHNVILPTTYSHIKGGHATAGSLLAAVGLKERTNTIIDNLSGGEKQRVAIARALINNPNIILADEPTGNLDSKTGHGIIDLLEKFNKAGVTVIIVTHDKEIVSRARRVVRIKDGAIIKQ